MRKEKKVLTLCNMSSVNPLYKNCWRVTGWNQKEIVSQARAHSSNNTNRISSFPPFLWKHTHFQQLKYDKLPHQTLLKYRIIPIIRYRRRNGLKGLTQRTNDVYKCVFRHKDNKGDYSLSNVLIKVPFYTCTFTYCTFIRITSMLKVSNRAVIPNC